MRAAFMNIFRDTARLAIRPVPFHSDRLTTFVARHGASQFLAGPSILGLTLCRYLAGKIPHILPSNYSATLSPR
jgi:hypothetical protein